MLSAFARLADLQIDMVQTFTWPASLTAKRDLQAPYSRSGRGGSGLAESNAAVVRSRYQIPDSDPLYRTSASQIFVETK